MLCNIHAKEKPIPPVIISGCKVLDSETRDYEVDNSQAYPSSEPIEDTPKDRAHEVYTNGSELSTLHVAKRYFNNHQNVWNPPIHAMSLSDLWANW